MEAVIQISKNFKTVIFWVIVFIVSLIIFACFWFLVVAWLFLDAHLTLIWTEIKCFLTPRNISGQSLGGRELTFWSILLWGVELKYLISF